MKKLLVLVAIAVLSTGLAQAKFDLVSVAQKAQDKIDAAEAKKIEAQSATEAKKADVKAKLEAKKAELEAKKAEKEAADEAKLAERKAALENMKKHLEENTEKTKSDFKALKDTFGK